ncbi:MAG: DUF362 domain-containing protein [Promethearchaeota archaeon]
MTVQESKSNSESKSSAVFFYNVLLNHHVRWLLSLNSWEKKDNQSIKTSILLLGAASLLWFLFRTGTRPTRVVYPCQRAAINTVSVSAQVILPSALTSVSTGFSWHSILVLAAKIKSGVKRYWKPILVLVIIIPTAGLGFAFLMNSLQPAPNPEDVNLILTPQTATSSSASNIFVLNGRPFAHIINLIDLMGSQGLDFYLSSTDGINQGPTGLIDSNDVVLIKINSQWAERGGTNTDLLRELIQAILNHPDSFTGEIVIADNGQGFGTLNWDENNAEDHSQSVSDVVRSFSTLYSVNMFDWQTIRGNEVDEYSDGDMTDGYILYDLPDPDTGVYVSYPKFQTTDGTYISFKYGIWNGTSYENRLKIINLPILKSHVNYGVTGASKHYMGVESEGYANPGGLANGHYCIATGGMGTLLAETRYPVLNILDAIWVNANPWPSFHCGPSTDYEEATRINVLMASTDPIALDYWAAKHVLMQTANLTGFNDMHTIDPDNTLRSGQTEALGVWLPLTEAELMQNGFTVTSNESRMNVYIVQTLPVPLDYPFLSIRQVQVMTLYDPPKPTTSLAKIPTFTI